MKNKQNGNRGEIMATNYQESLNNLYEDLLQNYLDLTNKLIGAINELKYDIERKNETIAEQDDEIKRLHDYINYHFKKEDKEVEHE